MRWIYSSIQTWNRWNKKLRWLLRKFWIPNVVPKTWTFLRVLISPSNTQNFGVSAYLIRHIGILPVHQQTFTTTRWDLHHAMTYELLESILLQSYFQKLSACSGDYTYTVVSPDRMAIATPESGGDLSGDRILLDLLGKGVFVDANHQQNWDVSTFFPFFLSQYQHIRLYYLYRDI